MPERQKLTRGMYWYPEHRVLAVHRHWGWMVLVADDSMGWPRWLQRSCKTRKEIEEAMLTGDWD